MAQVRRAYIGVQGIGFRADVSHPGLHDLKQLFTRVRNVLRLISRGIFCVCQAYTLQMFTISFKKECSMGRDLEFRVGPGEDEKKRLTVSM